MVTPLAADPAFAPNGPSPNGEPYALFVGALQARKEATTAIEALALVGEGAPRLVLVGPDKGGRAEVEETAARLGVPVELRGHSRRTSWPRSTAAPPASSSRAATRASACRCSRRWPRARRSWRPPPARCRRWPATRPCWSSPATRSRSRAGSSARSPTTSACARPASARAARYSWAETARLTLEAYRELLLSVAAVVIWTPGDPDPGPCLDSLAPQVDELVLTVNPGGSPSTPRGRGDRQRAHARLRREHQPRRRGHEPRRS